MTVDLLARFPGTAKAAHDAREFARSVLGPGHPAADTVDLLTTELVANAIAHTRSGLPGGVVTVTVRYGPDGVVVRVRDDGSDGAPRLANEVVGLAEHGRGMFLVDVLADEWGSDVDQDGRTVWFGCWGDQ